MSNDEIWKNVSWHEAYMVSNLGRVKSVPHIDNRGRPWPGKVLTPFLTGKSPGYPTVEIGKKHAKVHKLVADAFLEKKQSHQCVNHKDGNKNNNAVNNLEWCTNKENSRHSYDVLGRVSSGGHLGKLGAKHHASKEVHGIPPGGSLAIIFGSGAEAARYIGCGSGSVPRACNGIYKAVKGWRLWYAPIAINGLVKP